MWWRILIAVVCAIVIVVGMVVGVFFASYPLRYKADIRSVSAQFNIEPCLIASVIHAESRFRANSISNKGAIGLMQLMPRTAKYMAVKLGMGENIIENLTEPAINIKIGTAYLAYLLERFDDERTAIMAYNAGEGNVRRWLANDDFAKTVTRIGEDGEVIKQRVLVTTPFRETNAYVARVMSSRRAYRFRF